MSRFRAVVFDLDDTLYPERQYVLSGFRAVGRWLERRHGGEAEATAQEMVAISESVSRGATFDTWLLRHGYDLGLVGDMVTVYREHRPEIQPFPETESVLEVLRPHYKLGILSDGYLAVQKLKFEALGLGRYFDAVMFTDELGPDAWKPSPRAFSVLL
ncbi:MAG TPA: HAD family hydrolase, partial [Chloroflexota bacterium]|nr:HAD family hydrolase [Chloroflexota bacterium]